MARCAIINLGFGIVRFPFTPPIKKTQITPYVRSDYVADGYESRVSMQPNPSHPSHPSHQPHQPPSPIALSVIRAASHEQQRRPAADARARAPKHLRLPAQPQVQEDREDPGHAQRGMYGIVLCMVLVLVVRFMDGFSGAHVYGSNTQSHRACASAATTRWSGARSTASTSPSRCVFLGWRGGPCLLSIPQASPRRVAHCPSDRIIIPIRRID